MAEKIFFALPIKISQKLHFFRNELIYNIFEVKVTIKDSSKFMKLDQVNERLLYRNKRGGTLLENKRNRKYLLFWYSLPFSLFLFLFFWNCMLNFYDNFQKELQFSPSDYYGDFFFLYLSVIFKECCFETC